MVKQRLEEWMVKEGACCHNEGHVFVTCGWGINQMSIWWVRVSELLTLKAWLYKSSTWTPTPTSPTQVQQQFPTQHPVKLSSNIIINHHRNLSTRRSIYTWWSIKSVSNCFGCLLVLGWRIKGKCQTISISQRWSSRIIAEKVRSAVNVVDQRKGDSQGGMWKWKRGRDDLEIHGRVLCGRWRCVKQSILMVSHFNRWTEQVQVPSRI